MTTTTRSRAWGRAALLLVSTSALAGAPVAQEAGAEAPNLTLEQVLLAPRTLVPDVPRLAWITDTESFSVVTRDANGEDSVARVTLDGRVEKALDAEDLAAAFEEIPDLDARFRPAERSIPPFSWEGANTLRFVRPDAVYRWNLDEAAPETVIRWADPDPGVTRAIAPGDVRVVSVVDDDLVVEGADGSSARITWDGADGDIVYGGAAHRAEFGIRGGLWWSPDAQRLAFSREDMRAIAVYPYVDYTTKPAAPRHGRYPMAGQPHSKVTIHVYDVATASTVVLEHDASADLYWTNVTFTPDGREVWVALVDRGQTNCRLARFDARTGEHLADVLHESDPEWIEPEWGPIFLPGAKDRFLWASPRDGFRNLYEYGVDGTLRRPLTRAAFDLVSFGGFGEDGACCYVTGSGDGTPLEMHLWRVDLGTGAMRRLTPQGGRHACLVSDDDHLLSTQASADAGAAVIHLVPRGGEPRAWLRIPDPMARLGIRTEFVELAVEGAEPATLHGYVLHPPGFDPARRYPMVHYVYGGPHSQLVTDRAFGGANLWLRYMAGQGYVVTCVDNRGTDNRGIEFAQAVHRRLGQLDVHDQLAFVDHVVARGYVDPKRIGVHGWSYGGYMTLRLMLLGEGRFRAGVSGAPVTDWSRYETGYTERYMDTPAENPKGYAQASVLPLAGKLQGRLLLVTPSDDRTVMASHSVAFLQACVDDAALVDHIVYPMQQHGLRGNARVHFYRTMTRYFEDHLGPGGPTAGD